MARTRKKIFKVMTRRNPSDFGPYVLEESKLKTVSGYFKNIEAEPVFIYYNNLDHKWYVVDVLTGLAVTHGRTMYIAKEKFIGSLKRFREYKCNEIYYEALLKYNELIKKEKEENESN